MLSCHTFCNGDFFAIAVGKRFKKESCKNDHWVMKSNTTHKRLTAARIRFWELECQILSNIYSFYCYLSGVSKCLRNALGVLTQQALIAECWVSFLLSITHRTGGFKVFYVNTDKEPL